MAVVPRNTPLLQVILLGRKRSLWIPPFTVNDSVWKEKITDACHQNHVFLSLIVGELGRGTWGGV